MNDLNNISDQQLSTYTIDQALEKCSQEEFCTLIADESCLVDFIARDIGVVKSFVNNIIVVRDKLNSVYPFLKNESLLLGLSLSIDKAIMFSFFGAKLCSDLIYVSEKKEAELESVVESLSLVY